MADSRVLIDKEKIRAVIRETGSEKAKLSKDLGYLDTYISSLLSPRGQTTMEEKDEKLLCYMLGVQPGHFVKREEEERTQEVEGFGAEHIEKLEKKLDVLMRGMDKVTHEILDSIEAMRSKLNANTIQLEKMKQFWGQYTKTEKDRAIEFLKNILKDGRMNAPEVLNAADAAGIKRAVVMEARKEVGVEIDVTGYGKSQKLYWYIPR